MAPRESGFAEYIVMPERNLVSVPGDVVLSIATLTEPIAYGWYAVRKAKAVIHKKDQDIRALVIGGGAIGLGAALSCSAQGIKNRFDNRTKRALPRIHRKSLRSVVYRS